MIAVFFSVTVADLQLPNFCNWIKLCFSYSYGRLDSGFGFELKFNFDFTISFVM